MWVNEWFNFLFRCHICTFDRYDWQKVDAYVLIQLLISREFCGAEDFWINPNTPIFMWIRITRKLFLMAPTIKTGEW